MEETISNSKFIWPWEMTGNSKVNIIVSEILYKEKHGVKGNTQALRDKVRKTKAKTHFIWQEARKP